MLITLKRIKGKTLAGGEAIKGKMCTLSCLY